MSKPPPPTSSKPAELSPGAEPSTTAPDELTFNTAPNLLTLLRMAFVPLVVALLFLGDEKWQVWAAWIFVAASITDYFDGYLARRQKLVTVYGKLMDPLADKFLVVSSLIMLQHLGRIHPIVVILLICREMAITGLRALASAEGLIIAASDSAKWKTATQMTAIPFIMARHLGPIPLETTGLVLLYLSLAMSLWSAKDYVVGFFGAIRKKREHKAQERKNARTARLAARAARLAAKAAKRRDEPTPLS